MSWVVTIGGFLASLWLSYLIFPFRGDEPGSTGFSRFVVTGIGTAIAAAIAFQIDKRRTAVAAEEAVAADLATRSERPPRDTRLRVHLPADWSRALEESGVTPSDVQDILARAYAAPGTVFPDPSAVFRAFDLTPLADVRVVIVGQDPYPTRSEADGLAFSVRQGAPARYSLRRIFDNLIADPRVTFDLPSSGGDLSNWARNGVLLLNASLTVREGQAGSDATIWSHFTASALQVVAQKAEPVVFMLWGDKANELVDRVGVLSHHKVLRSTHPRREEESAYPRFADTRQFSVANDFLLQTGRGSVDWRL